MKARKSNFDLESAVGRKQLTKDGKEWLTLALDPFHDWNVPIAGYPDADCSNTVVQCFQYQADLVSPNAAWDCHIRVNQYVNSSTEYQSLGSANAATQWTGSTSSSPAGILQITTCDSGQPLAPSGAALWAPTNGTHSVLGTYSDLLFSNSRIIGLGFEVINTSAEIYKQGSLTAYKMPQTIGKTAVAVTNAAGTATGVIHPYTLRFPPSTVALASMLHGTVTWEAAKGAYVVCTQSTTNNDLSPVTYEPSMRSADGTVTAATYQDICNLAFAPVAIPCNVYKTTAAKVYPFNTHGVMVTGLNTNSTLRVRLRVYVERAPGPGNAADTALIPLATPSAGYDAAAIKVYSEVAARMPVAVPVDFNSFGDWWKIISGIAKTVAVPIGALVGGPTGAALGGVVAGGLSGVDQVFRKGQGPAGSGPVPEVMNPGSKDFKLQPFIRRSAVPGSAARNTAKKKNARKRIVRSASNST